MTPAARVRITEAFEHALSLSPSERETYILSSGDRKFIEEVRARFHIGKYTVTDLIGEGGMGRVFGAFDTRDQGSVAIKVLVSPDAPEMVGRFRTEADLISKLKHPCIVAALESGVENGAPYLVMERLTGRTLLELIQKNVLTLLEKLEIMSEVAAGLQYLHQQGVTHRDIKPANIMRLTEGAVKIMDFGISRAASGEVPQWHTRTGFLVGSPTYMAPELFAGEKANSGTDIFAYCVIFYELLTGINPCKVASIGGVEYPMPYSVPKSVSELVPRCPPDLGPLISKGLAEKPPERYQTMDELIADLQPVLTQFRSVRADELFGEAVQLYLNGQMEQADSVARRALVLDPTHEHAGRLCDRLDEIRRLEKMLDDRLFDDAQALLRSIPQAHREDPQMAPRFQAAEARLEKHRRSHQLVNTARQYLDGGNLQSADETIARVLADDPSSTLGKRLAEDLRQRLAARDAERLAARQLQERIAGLRLAAVSSIRAGNFDRAILSLGALIEASPHEPDLTELLKAAVAGKARRLQPAAHSGKRISAASVGQLVVEFFEKRSVPLIVPFAAAALVLLILLFVTKSGPAPPKPVEALALKAPPVSNAGTVGQPASLQLHASGGKPPYAWTIVAGALPPGLRLNPNSGSLDGSFAQTGSFAFTVQASDRASHTARQNASFAVSKSQITPKPAPMPPPAPAHQDAVAAAPRTAPCKAAPFSLELYGDQRSGSLRWMVNLKSGGQADVPPDPGSLIAGSMIPRGVPVRLTAIPDTIQLIAKPSAENCWNSPVRVKNAGPDIQGVTIYWDVIQP